MAPRRIAGTTAAVGGTPAGVGLRVCEQGCGMKRTSDIAEPHYVHEVCLLRDRVPSFDKYPFSLPAIRHLDRLELHPKVTYFIGENGIGKSTLLEAIAVAWGFNPEGGSRNFNFSSRETHSALHSALRLVKSPRRPSDGFFLRAESFYNVASEVERLGAVRGYGGRS